MDWKPEGTEEVRRPHVSSPSMGSISPLGHCGGAGVTVCCTRIPGWTPPISLGHVPHSHLRRVIRWLAACKAPVFIHHYYYSSTRVHGWYIAVLSYNHWFPIYHVDVDYDM